MQKGIRLKLSGNEADYTNSLTLPVKNMLCSKLHSRIFLNLIPFPYGVERQVEKLRLHIEPEYDSGSIAWMNTYNPPTLHIYAVVF